MTGPIAGPAGADQLVAEVWEELLDDVGGDFFDLGGDSLRAIQLAGRISEALDVEVSASMILELRTLDALIRGVRERPAGRVGREAAIGGQPIRPLSAPQCAILLADELASEPGLYNVTLTLMLSGRLDVAALTSAVRQLSDRHEALRCRLVSTPDGPAHAVDERAGTLLECYRVAGAGPVVAEGLALAKAESTKSFDLWARPPVRAILFELDRQRHLLVLVLHHVVSDRRSRELMAHELIEAYDSKVLVPPPPVAVESAPPPARVTEGLHPATPSSARITGVIATAARDRLRRFHSEHGVTAFAVLLTAFAVLWSRCIGEAELRIGVPMTTRRSVEEQGMVGCFVEVRPMTVRLGRGRSFVAAVGEVSDQLRKLNGTAGGGPVEVAATYLRRTPLPLGRTLRWEPIELPPPGARFGLDLVLDDDGTTIDVQIDYRCSLVPSGLAGSLAERYVALVSELLAHPGQPVDRCQLRTAADSDQLASWEDGGPACAAEPVPVAVAGQARERPQAPAIVCEQETMTYADLDQRADRLAGSLVRAGAGPETVVALCCDPSPAFVVGALGIMKAGAACLPMDTSAPKDRIARVVAQSGARLAVAQRRGAGLIPRAVDVVDLEGSHSRAAGLPPDPPDPRTLAYVVYTSGSTGRPKGVQVPHASLTALVGWTLTDSALRPGDHCAQIAALGANVVSWEVWSCLAAGATLHIAPEAARASPEKLAGWLERSGINLAFVPTTMLTQLLSLRSTGHHQLQVLHTGGDVLYRHRPAGSGYRLVNNYGPTETTVFATSGEVSDGVTDSGRPTIGRPIAGTRVHVLDGNLDRQIPGAAGELFIGGAGVARGYLADPAQTAERFVPDPFSRTPGARLYRTGDRARFGADGELEFLGRLDRQIKVDGVRVEPTDVEAALLGLPGIHVAAVTVRQTGDRGPRLAAHIVAVPSLDPAGIRRELAKRLPRAMVPTSVQLVPAMPLTGNGKLDRRALAVAPPPGRPVAPGTPVESALAAIWSEVLGVEPVSVDDHLVEMGGGSVAAARIAALIGDRLGVELPMADLFDLGTIAKIAVELAKRGRT